MAAILGIWQPQGKPGSDAAYEPVNCDCKSGFVPIFPPSGTVLREDHVCDPEPVLLWGAEQKPENGEVKF